MPNITILIVLHDIVHFYPKRPWSEYSLVAIDITRISNLKARFTFIHTNYNHSTITIVNSLFFFSQTISDHMFLSVESIKVPVMNDLITGTYAMSDT